MIIPVIIAGGSGTRLWPLSRALYPKQLLDLVNEHTMLQDTVLRVIDFEDAGSPIILCNEDHRFMVAEQLQAINVGDASIILEPIGRNTAPAVAVAALKALTIDSDSLILVLPADHFIQNVEAFHKAIGTGLSFAENGNLLTFGIVPDGPETGYGYIKKDALLEKSEAYTIKEFVEKPDIETAQKYINSGEYYWNSGMFLFKASRVLEELEKFVPDIVNSCKAAFEHGETDLDFFRLDENSFKACPSDSIDYAVMEKTEVGVMVPLEAGWSDIGSWDALWQIGKKDNNKNVVHGDVLIKDVKNSFFHADNRLIAAVGLENHIVVETADAVLISPRNRVQDVKQLVEKLKKKEREETLYHRKVFRPWGSYETIDTSERFQVKKLTIKPDGKLSLQKHHHRSEHWVVVKGIASVTKGDEKFILSEDESTFIPIGVPHRLENKEKTTLQIIEVRTGNFLGEEDIVRIDDAYGR